MGGMWWYSNVISYEFSLYNLYFISGKYALIKSLIIFQKTSQDITLQVQSYKYYYMYTDLNPTLLWKTSLYHLLTGKKFEKCSSFSPISHFNNIINRNTTSIGLLVLAPLAECDLKVVSIPERIIISLIQFETVLLVKPL